MDFVPSWQMFLLTVPVRLLVHLQPAGTPPTILRNDMA